ncbi:MAG TPA: hypothetical protein VG604_00230 [Candidatus Saccharimonadales bacterium]|nr:hypothetical protein [Candidatus Saccharimonadales bacterium]
MAEHQGKSAQAIKDSGWNYDDHLKHWRSWGSWFSWGSPVGLGLFFLATAATLWVLSKAFWNA